MCAGGVEVVLVVGRGCPHCHLVLRHVNQLLAAGEIGSVEIIQGEEEPERLRQLGVGTVPWLRMGIFELEGLLTLHELRQWLGRVGDMRGMAVYFDHLFSRGQRQRVAAMVRCQPELLQAFVYLLADEEVGINTRLGVGVVLEEIAASGLVATIVHGLGEITRHASARLRGDACYYLSFTNSREGMAYLQACLSDPHPEVREIAQESWETLQEGVGK